VSLGTAEKAEVVWGLLVLLHPHPSPNRCFRKGWEIGKALIPPPLAGLSRQDGTTTVLHNLQLVKVSSQDERRREL